MRQIGLVLLIVFSVWAMPVGSQGLHFTSPAREVRLVELYTSEGCSSCPPADRRLSGLQQKEGLWRDFVPVAFHVDYWDYIGWRDRFADPDHSLRQHAYARTGGVSQVYTPALVVQGREWRGWFRNLRFDDGSASAAGVLQLDLEGDEARVAFEPAFELPDGIVVTVALLGFDLTSEIPRGENTGKTLHHDFVVLGTSRMPLRRHGARFVGTATLPRAQQPATRMAVAAWVSASENPAPLQAVGGWLSEQYLFRTRYHP